MQTMIKIDSEHGASTYYVYENVLVETVTRDDKQYYPIHWANLDVTFNTAELEPDAPEPDAPEPDAPEPDAPEPDAPEPDAPKENDTLTLSSSGYLFVSVDGNEIYKGRRDGDGYILDELVWTK